MEPVDIGVDLAREGGILRRVTAAVLGGWSVNRAETERILEVLDAMRGELLRMCSRPARMRLELSHAWPLVTLVMRCGDVLAVEYCDVSGLLGMSALETAGTR